MRAHCGCVLLGLAACYAINALPRFRELMLDPRTGKRGLGGPNIKLTWHAVMHAIYAASFCTLALGWAGEERVNE